MTSKIERKQHTHKIVESQSVITGKKYITFLTDIGFKSWALDLMEII